MDDIIGLSLDELIEDPSLLSTNKPYYLSKDYNEDNSGCRFAKKDIDKQESNERLKERDDLIESYNSLIEREKREERESDDRKGNKHFGVNSGQIFVANITWRLTDHELRSVFDEFGPLIRGYVNYRRDGRSEGTGFVVFKRYEDAHNACRQLDGTDLDGRYLRLHLFDSSGRVISGWSRKRKHTFKDPDIQPDTSNIKIDDLIDLKLDDYIKRRKYDNTWD
ncbi:polyadenylate-binding protein 1-like, partial [Oppia nitens]|uniref:polyadenylate-binding protein 1-like n=1 Tax=Oppia nitens TaxID=1686743 RepID=UPI0023D9A48B